MDAKVDFTQANSIPLLAQIIKKLFRCYKHLKLNSLFVGWGVNKEIVQMLQASKTQFFACFNYNKRIVWMLQISKTQFLACFLALMASQLYFRLLVGLVGLTVGLAISEAELIGEEVAFDFSGYFL